MKKSLGMYLSCFFKRVILLMEEILHHLGYIKPCKQDKLPINWCRVSSIKSMFFVIQPVLGGYQARVTGNPSIFLAEVQEGEGNMATKTMATN